MAGLSAACPRTEGLLLGPEFLGYLAPLQAGVQLVKDAQSIYRDWKAARGGAPEELEQKLEQAQEQLKMAEVATARDFGYRICRRHGRRASCRRRRKANGGALIAVRSNSLSGLSNLLALVLLSSPSQPLSSLRL